MKASSQSPVRRFTWIVLYCLFGISALASALVAVSRSTTPLLAGASIAGILTGLIIGVTVVGGLSFLKNRQVREVGMRSGGIRVVAVEGQHDLTRALRRLGLAAEDTKFVTVSFDASDVTFWRGVVEPLCFARIPREVIHAWELESFVHGARTYQRLVLLTATVHEVVRVPVCLNRPGTLKLLLAKPDQIEEIMAGTSISREGHGPPL
jgi:hypothetical protein